MFYRSDDLSRDIDQYLRSETEALNRMPVCFGCGEHITGEDAYLILNHLYCEDCFYDSAIEEIKRMCRVNTENYVGTCFDGA